MAGGRGGRQAGGLITGYCPRCLLWHDVPTDCRHDIGQPCPRCQRPFGGRWVGMAGDVCWRCWYEAERSRPPGCDLPETN